MAPRRFGIQVGRVLLEVRRKLMRGGGPLEVQGLGFGGSYLALEPELVDLHIISHVRPFIYSQSASRISLKNLESEAQGRDAKQMGSSDTSSRNGGGGGK